MSTQTNHNAIETLGYAIAARGIDADPATLVLLAHSARDLDVNGLLVDVMVDESAPSVARIRAFARVSSLVSKALDDRGITARRELAHAC